MSKPHSEHEALPAGWAALEQRFQAAPLRGPRPGLGRRWLARQQAESQRTALRRAWGLALLNGSATFLLALVLLQGFVPLVSEPGSTLAAVMEGAADLALSLIAIANLVNGLVGQVPEAVWLLMGTAAMALTLASALLLSKVGWIKGDME